MANIKSAKKRILTAEANRVRNVAVKLFQEFTNYVTKLFQKVFYTKILLQERNQDLFLLSKS